MSKVSKLRAGLIGYGIGRVYAAGLQSLRAYYPDLPGIEMAEVVTRTEASGVRAQHDFGFERRSTDYRAMLAAKDIDLVVIATPPDLHGDMAIEAMRAGKAVLIDKPLCADLASARRAVDEAEKLGRDAHMMFEFRYAPAMQRAQSMLREGQFGPIQSFRGEYLRGSYIEGEKPVRWKGVRSVSGGGSLNDTAPHVIDLLLWMLGPFRSLTAQTRTFIHERPGADGRPMQVETDDHVIVQASLPGGAIGTVESGRLIVGAINDLSIEVYGERGSFRWSLMQPNFLEVAFMEGSHREPAWRRIPTVQRYADAPIPGWDMPVGMMRFYIASLADFVRRFLDGRAFDPGLKAGLAVQTVVDAAERAAASGAWVDVPGG